LLARNTGERAVVYFVIKHAVEKYSTDLFDFYLDKHLVVRVEKQDRRFLRARWFDSIRYRFAVHLSDFIRLNCIDKEFVRYMNTFLDEKQFRELMSRYIRKCFKSKSAVNRRLEKLEDFIQMRIGRMKYPAVVDCNRLNHICKVLEVVKDHTTTYGAGSGVLWLFDDRFCLELYLSSDLLFFPYSPYDIDVKAVKKLAIYERRLLEAIRKIANIKEQEQSDRRLENVLETLEYVVLLIEMLREPA